MFGKVASAASCPSFTQALHLLLPRSRHEQIYSLGGPPILADHDACRQATRVAAVTKQITYKLEFEGIRHPDPIRNFGVSMPKLEPLNDYTSTLSKKWASQRVHNRTCEVKSQVGTAKTAFGIASAPELMVEFTVGPKTSDLSKLTGPCSSMSCTLHGHAHTERHLCTPPTSASSCDVSDIQNKNHKPARASSHEGQANRICCRSCAWDFSAQIAGRKWASQ